MLVEARSKKIAAIVILILIAFVALWLLVPSGIVSDSARFSPDVLAAIPATYRPEKVSFVVRVKGLSIPYRVFGVFVMPGETVSLEAVFDSDGRAARAQVVAGRLEETGEGRWTWTAPRVTGWYPITITDQLTGEIIRLNVFVMEPYDPSSESVGTFHIGRYPARARRNNPVFARPKGFVQVTEYNEDVLVSPHFTLGQFVSKQSAQYPAYLLLQEKLLLKLEAILEKLNERGIHANTLHIMSGYRTPHVDALVGTVETEDSPHFYGAAADVFVDMDEDGYMDDLDGDGEITSADARVLADLVESLREDTLYSTLTGGLGIYGPVPHRGPFIHIDVRGQVVRW